MSPASRWKDREREFKRNQRASAPKRRKKRKKPALQRFADRMRNDMSVPEARLWLYLRHCTGPLAIHAQAVVAGFIPDFVNRATKLAIEIDGKFHLEPENVIKDAARTAKIRAAGWEVIRFTASETLYDPANVATRIMQAIQARLR